MTVHMELLYFFCHGRATVRARDSANFSLAAKKARQRLMVKENWWGRVHKELRQMFCWMPPHMALALLQQMKRYKTWEVHRGSWDSLMTSRLLEHGQVHQKQATFRTIFSDHHQSTDYKRVLKWLWRGVRRGQSDGKQRHAECRPLDLGDDAPSHQRDGWILELSFGDALVGSLSSTRPCDLSDVSVLSHGGVEVSPLPSYVGTRFWGPIEEVKIDPSLWPGSFQAVDEFVQSRLTLTDRRLHQLMQALGEEDLFIWSLNKGTFDLIGCVLPHKRHERADSHSVGTCRKVCQRRVNGRSLLNGASPSKRKPSKGWWKEKKHPWSFHQVPSKTRWCGKNNWTICFARYKTPRRTTSRSPWTHPALYTCTCHRKASEKGWEYMRCNCPIWLPRDRHLGCVLSDVQNKMHPVLRQRFSIASVANLVGGCFLTCGKKNAHRQGCNFFQSIDEGWGSLNSDFQLEMSKGQ